VNVEIQVGDAVSLGVSVATHVAGAAFTLLLGYFIAVAVRRLTGRVLAHSSAESLC